MHLEGGPHTLRVASSDGHSFRETSESPPTTAGAFVSASGDGSGATASREAESSCQVVNAINVRGWKARLYDHRIPSAEAI